MYVKFFKNKKGGSTASIKYLLNEREKEGTAKILQGDRDLTESIINSISNKQKATVGVLSFEEQSLTNSQKEELMREFEKTIFAGMEQDEYNILWVEHTDKNRLELNFVIPKLHLPTQKAMNPYFHAVDFPRIEMFEDIYNIKFGLTSKKDPSKAQTLLGSKKEFNLFKDYKQLDNQLYELVQSGDIQNREQMIELLKENNIEVTRIGKDYMSLKLPEAKRAKKFKGGIFNEQFTSTQELKTLSDEADRRAEKFQSRNTSRELERTIKKLNEFNEQKAQYHRKKFQQKNNRNTRAEQEPIHEKESLNGDRNIIRNVPNVGGNTSRIHSKIQKSEQMDSAERDEIPRREWEVHSEQSGHMDNWRQKRPKNNKNRRLEYDARRRTIKRNRERAAKQRESYSEARKSRIEIHKRIISESKKLREKPTDYRTELYSEAQRVVRERRNRRRARNGLREACKSFGDTIGRISIYVKANLEKRKAHEVSNTIGMLLETMTYTHIDDLQKDVKTALGLNVSFTSKGTIDLNTKEKIADVTYSDVEAKISSRRRIRDRDYSMSMR